MKDILAEIERQRMKRGWSERELSLRSGLSQSTISACFRLKRNPTAPILDKICGGFCMTLSQFLAEEGEAMSLTSEQWKALCLWSELDENQRNIVNRLMKSMCKS
ncbi:XRE family transcriptional regulator [Butyricicoccus sp. 1XD8-22]|nr:XRE family transcriptional regulator [Butyricicoccus sp. 1XD8-22]